MSNRSKLSDLGKNIPWVFKLWWSFVAVEREHASDRRSWKSSTLVNVPPAAAPVHCLATESLITHHG